MAQITYFAGLSDGDDTEECNTVESDTAEGDTAEGDNLNLRRLKRKRADDDDQSGELISVDIFICNDATDGAHTPNDGGSDTAGINPRDLSDDERSVSDVDPGPVKIGPPRKGTKCQYYNGKRFH